MKFPRKLLALLLALLLLFSAAFSLVSCKPRDKAQPMTVGVLAGPTGMGMAKLICDEKNAESSSYNFRLYSDPSVATTDLLSGNLDFLCLPTNAAANLYAKTEGGVRSVAVNCLGSLYAVAKKDMTVRSLADLEGKTIVTSVPSSTTGPILEAMLKTANIRATIETVADHDALVAAVVKGEAEIAILPEPKVTAALMTATAYECKLNLSAEWDKLFHEPLTMGCLVGKTEFLEKYPASVKEFLEAYRASVSYIAAPEHADDAAAMIVSAGVLPKLPIAKGALKNLSDSLVCLTDAEMQAAMGGFYETIGMKRPDSGFYYLP